MSVKTGCWIYLFIHGQITIDQIFLKKQIFGKVESELDIFNLYFSAQPHKGLQMFDDLVYSKIRIYVNTPPPRPALVNLHA